MFSDPSGLSALDCIKALYELIVALVGPVACVTCLAILAGIIAGQLLPGGQFTLPWLLGEFTACGVCLAGILELYKCEKWIDDLNKFCPS
jgi:hypothetical protein